MTFTIRPNDRAAHFNYHTEIPVSRIQEAAVKHRTECVSETLALLTEPGCLSETIEPLSKSLSRSSVIAVCDHSLAENSKEKINTQMVNLCVYRSNKWPHRKTIERPNSSPADRF